MSEQQYRQEWSKPYGGPPKPKTCPREHLLVGRNRRSNGACSACDTAFQRAKRQRLFYDDPSVIEHANRLYARYIETGGVT